MSTNIIKLLIVTTLVIFGYMWYQNNEEVQGNVLGEKPETIPPIVKENKSIEPVLERSIKNLNVVDELKVFAERLLPIHPDDLIDGWKDEFGCYVNGGEQLKEILLAEECEFKILSASSYEEALWMQKQGYPGRSSLQLLDDKVNQSQIEKLARQNFPPAMALMALRDFQQEDYANAASWALNLNAHSNKQKTFAYRMRGEALIANDVKDLGVVELKIASFLGDTEAGYMFNRYAFDNPIMGMHAVDNAHLYMSRVFAVPYDQYPSDPRPKANGGG